MSLLLLLSNLIECCQINVYFFSQKTHQILKTINFWMVIREYSILNIHSYSSCFQLSPQKSNYISYIPIPWLKRLSEDVPVTALTCFSLQDVAEVHSFEDVLQLLVSDVFLLHLLNRVRIDDLISQRSHRHIRPEKRRKTIMNPKSWDLII